MVGFALTLDRAAKLKRAPVTVGARPVRIAVHDENVRATGVVVSLNSRASLRNRSRFGVTPLPPNRCSCSSRSESMPNRRTCGRSARVGTLAPDWLSGQASAPITSKPRPEATPKATRVNCRLTPSSDLNTAALTTVRHRTEATDIKHFAQWPRPDRRGHRRMIVGADQGSRKPECVVGEACPGKDAEPAHHHSSELPLRRMRDSRRRQCQQPGDRSKRDVYENLRQEKNRDVPCDSSTPRPTRSGLHDVGRLDAIEESHRRRVSGRHQKDDPERDTDPRPAPKAFPTREPFVCSRVQSHHS